MKPILGWRNTAGYCKGYEGWLNLGGETYIRKEKHRLIWNLKTQFSE